MSSAPGTSGVKFGVGALVIVAVLAAVVGGALGFGAGRNAERGAQPSVVAPHPPSATPAPIEHLELGAEAETLTGGRVKVLTWEQVNPPNWPKPPPGFRHSRAVVQFCPGPGVWNFRIREIPYLFNLVTTKGVLADPFVDERYNLEELASYNTGLISAGDCVVGSIIFKSSSGDVIRAVRFTGHGRFEWDVEDIALGTSPAPEPDGEIGLLSPSPVPT